jgi:ADP-heptose:LPS heptosyltransferase
MKKLLLKCFLSPGDIVMLTAAVRDLHLCYPKQFVTDVRTACPELWENNPYITPLAENDPEVEQIDCHCPLINSSNEAPYHFVHAFIEFLNEHLNLHVKPAVFKGDIHISDREKSWWSQVQELTGEDTPFWIVVGGGKHDYTIKWWDVKRYQTVVNHFWGKVLFVQVGEKGHYHPELENVIDLRGKTDLRQLVRLVYHAQGVLCPVTSLMHLAAAVETKQGRPKNRPCVVVAGGREPSHWEAYPHHQFIHTNGALLCCEQGGCWRSRTAPLGDGDDKDESDSLCVDVVRNLPRCMDLITADEVIQRIELYFKGGTARYLTAAQMRQAESAVSKKSLSNYGSRIIKRAKR